MSSNRPGTFHSQLFVVTGNNMIMNNNNKLQYLLLSVPTYGNSSIHFIFQGKYTENHRKKAVSNNKDF